jgi:hypothetical protein
MASTTRNSTEVQVVFGTDATLATKVVGAAFDARDNSANVKVAPYTFTSTAKSADGTPDVENLAVLPNNAKVLFATMDIGGALQASSGEVTIKIDGSAVGDVMASTGAANLTTGLGNSPVQGSAGVVTLTYSNHDVNAVAVKGSIYYTIDG